MKSTKNARREWTMGLDGGLSTGRRRRHPLAASVA
jgi:hypothetical protein